MRAFDVNGLEFFSGTHIYQAKRRLLLLPICQLFRTDEELLIQLVTFPDMLEDFVNLQPAVPLAKRLQRLLRLKAATAAAADMVTPKERALSARKSLQDFLHG